MGKNDNKPEDQEPDTKTGGNLKSHFTRTQKNDPTHNERNMIEFIAASHAHMHGASAEDINRTIATAVGNYFASKLASGDFVNYDRAAEALREEREKAIERLSIDTNEQWWQDLMKYDEAALAAAKEHVANRAETKPPEPK